MEADEYARIAAVEDEHWWYVNTRALMLELLAPWLGGDPRVLDVGCGPGGNARDLARHGRVTALDRSAEALRFVEPTTRLHPVQGDAVALPVRSGSVDVVTCVHVLYTLADHRGALGEMARALAPGGVAFLMEPAFPILRRGHDRKVHGARRFGRGGLAGAAEAAGLVVRRSTFAYSFLTPPAAVLAAADRLRPEPVEDLRSDLQRRRLDTVFGPLSALERRIQRRWNVPVGTSTVVVASRR